MTSADEREPEHEGIFSQKARQAIDEAFARIDQPEELRAPARTEAETMGDGDSVEAVFERAVRGAVGPVIGSWMNSHRDELLGGMKPLIREWMDEHFPAILEGAIREEVARVVKARGRR
jgi:cell pole-organizing protein PopZ